MSITIDDEIRILKQVATKVCSVEERKKLYDKMIKELKIKKGIIRTKPKKGLLDIKKEIKKLKAKKKKEETKDNMPLSKRFGKGLSSSKYKVAPEPKLKPTKYQKKIVEPQREISEIKHIVKKMLKKQLADKKMSRHETSKTTKKKTKLRTIYEPYLEGKGIISDIWEFIKGVRQKFPPEGRKILQDHGDKQVIQITLYRQPIARAIETLGEIISGGKWSKAKQSLQYDKMFHLGMILELQDGTIITTEKNQTPELKKRISYSKQAQFKSIPVKKGISLNQFIANGIKTLGNNVWTYNASTSNCQVYVRGILQGNGLLSPEIEKWVVQNAVAVMKTIPNAPKKLIDEILKFASRADILIKGNGKKLLKGGGKQRRTGLFEPPELATPETFVENVKEAKSVWDKIRSIFGLGKKRKTLRGKGYYLDYEDTPEIRRQNNAQMAKDKFIREMRRLR